FGRRRNQAVCLSERGRSVRRIEQTSALENVWLVLFFDQRRFIHLLNSLSLASGQSEVRSWLGVWNSRYRDGDCHFVLLGRSQKNGPRGAGRSRLFKRNFQ